MDLIDRVWFRKPELERLKKQGFTAVDMHIHSRYSDGLMGVKGILKKARKLGIGVAITDHNEIRGSMHLAKEHIFAIPAIEVNAIEGRDVLVYFYDFEELREFYEKHIEKYTHKRLIGRAYKTVSEVVEDSKGYNCLVSLPHPFGYGAKNIAKKLKKNYVIEDVDAVEVMNSGQTKRRNRKALDLAQEHNKCFTGGTDAHSLTEVGKIVSFSKAGDVESFLNSVKKRKNFVMGKEANKLRCAMLHSALVGRHVKHPVSVARTYYKHGLTPKVEKLKPKLNGLNHKKSRRKKVKF